MDPGGLPEGTLPRVAIVVLNWNRPADTLRCLASLARLDYPAAEVMLVDNGSTDDSVAVVRTQFPTQRIIQSESNLGFAVGNNLALRLALDESFPYILLLNNDTVVAPDLVSRLLEPMLADERVGVSSGAICYLTLPDTLWSAGGRLDWSTGVVTNDFADVPLASLPNAPFKVDHVSGCAMLVRGAAIERAGLLDPRFFMYFEETEWCARIGRVGYDVVVNPAARVWHDVEPQRHLASAQIAYYMTRNHLLFLRASRAPWSAWRHTIYRQIRTLASLYLRPHSNDRRRGRVPMLRAMRDFSLGRFGPARFT